MKHESFKGVKTLFFDYDGCLHNSMKIYAPAFKKAYAYLVKHGYAVERNWKDEEIGYWLGFNSRDMWRNFMPESDEKIRTRCSLIIGKELKSLTRNGKAELYEGAKEVLLYLKSKGYHLVLISNCGVYYKEAHTNLFHLNEYFEEMACSEEYGYIPKYEILSIIKDRYPKDRVIIGDRKQDIEAGKNNGIYTIGCSYGFAADGELMEADLLIKDIAEIKEYF